jgi:hypothetical protein
MRYIAFLKNEKIITTVVALLVLVLLGIVAWMHYHPTNTAPTGAQNVANYPKYPPILGTLSTSTPTDITIQLQDGSQKTFTISSTTPVVSQVKAGEVGKFLTQLTSGIQLMVQPKNADASVAQSITVMTMPVAPANNLSGPPATISGLVISKTATSLTITNDSSPGINVVLGKNTIVLTNVLAGEKGKTLDDIAVNNYVVVFGTAGTRGLNAVSVQLLVPIPGLAQQ